MPERYRAVDADVIDIVGVGVGIDVSLDRTSRYRETRELYIVQHHLMAVLKVRATGSMIFPLVDDHRRSFRRQR